MWKFKKSSYLIDCNGEFKIKNLKQFSSFSLLQKDGEDDIKKKQLQDLAILNGTYRPPCSNDVANFPAQNGGTSK